MYKVMYVIFVGGEFLIECVHVIKFAMYEALKIAGNDRLLTHS